MFRTFAILGLLIATALVVYRLMRPRTGDVPLPPRRGRLIYWIMLIGAVVAALTSIGSIIVGLSPIGGWTLILHCLAAPFFAIGIAAIALLWAGRYMSDCKLPGSCSFWGMLISGMLTIFSIAFTMTPLFAEQHFLLQVHRYSSLALVIFMAAHAASIVSARRASA
jgi:hypothetical protein